MTDVTAAVNELLKSHDSGLIRPHEFSIEKLNSFLQEAYQINSRITDLVVYLRAIRQPYLSNAPPPHRPHGSRNAAAGRPKDKDRLYLDDSQRDEIDAEAKRTLKGLHAAVNGLSQAEKARQDINADIALKKRTNRFASVAKWAGGGGALAKSPEEIEEDARADALKVHREGVLWYLQRKLEECGTIQSSMMEVRLREVIEKSKSVSWRVAGYKGSSGPAWDSAPSDYAAGGDTTGASSSRRGLSTEELEGGQDRPQLSEDQMQLFAQENQDMLKIYESKLDQVRTAEKSLIEISELQSTLVSNLDIQAAHIDQLVQDSFAVAENVGSGNKELKKASERRSTARMVFYSTAALCGVVIVWDLII